MEYLVGKRARSLDQPALVERLGGHTRVLVDVGTGDGRFVRAAALADPAIFAIGLDACREQLRQTARTAPPNALYVIANALALPRELDARATHLTINFPWGSLLAGLLAGDPALVARLAAIARPGTALDVRLNAGALAEAGATLEDGAAAVRAALVAAGFALRRPVALGPAELRACPTTWAHRLAFGRDPRALWLHGRRT
ncbi:MAG TPA: class I SAM-dependent methyltransferase [Ktedonobacterales bacterium]|nr:class I SAM-dependent methyltransferase [Ktedonobacterales bacterium]